MTTTVDRRARVADLAAGCWADPLTKRERRELAKTLARACGRSYRAAVNRRGHAATALGATRWADPLTSQERRELAKLLARACGRSYRKRRGHAATALIAVSAEMSALHMDVTKRAAGRQA